MKTKLVRKFKTRNMIVRPDQKNFSVELTLDLEQDIVFNKEEKIKHHAIGDDYGEIKDIKYDLDENIREIIVEAKVIKAQTEKEFLLELQPHRDNGWCEK